MNQELVLQLARETMQVTLLVSGPLLIVSLVIGVLVSMAQVVTSIQDMTLSFVPRTIAVFLTCLFLFPWLMNTMIAFSIRLLGHLERFAH
jgi:flagellar biosynthesis protein FliQ